MDGVTSAKVFETTEVTEVTKITDIPIDKLPKGLNDIEVKPDTDIFEPVIAKSDIPSVNNVSLENNDGTNESNKENETGENKENTEYYSTYEERLQQTPVNNGKWEGERGESIFHSDDETVNKILDEFGLDGISYKDGIPDFSEVSKGTVEIDDMTENRDKNFRQADEALAKQRGCSPQEVKQWREEHGYTWHERNDMKTMDKVPTEINKVFGHLGGVSECKKRDEANSNWEDEFDE